MVIKLDTIHCSVASGVGRLASGLRT